MLEQRQMILELSNKFPDLLFKPHKELFSHKGSDNTIKVLGSLKETYIGNKPLIDYYRKESFQRAYANGILKDVYFWALSLGWKFEYKDPDKLFLNPKN